ncbi:MAG: hypothetical protein GDA43_18590 [Hormoscilla sp. SP5CHS1]|nr:hypothetical protein [Hormoscilla sp. SP12CHS1]MBC6454959.1 hypothetical protein [Hormoscilla sp. SP5CHS1]
MQAVRKELAKKGPGKGSGPGEDVREKRTEQLKVREKGVSSGQDVVI